MRRRKRIDEHKVGGMTAKMRVRQAKTFNAVDSLMDKYPHFILECSSADEYNRLFSKLIDTALDYGMSPMDYFVDRTLSSMTINGSSYNLIFLATHESDLVAIRLLMTE